MAVTQQRALQILQTPTQDLFDEWMREQQAVGLKGPELRKQAQEFLELLQEAVRHGNHRDLSAPEWHAIRRFLDDLSRARVLQGFTSEQTATFILSLKKPLFDRLRQLEKDPEALSREVWLATELIDRLGMLTVSAACAARGVPGARGEAG
jgi:rsbT co-antagonist protein RsbR